VSKAICDYPIDGGGKDMIVGVQNFDGDVYRIITATGMGAYIHVTSELAEIGLKDELANSLFGKGGFDSIFVTTEDLKRQRMVRTLGGRPTVIEEVESIETSLSKWTSQTLLDTFNSYNVTQTRGVYEQRQTVYRRI
jgi:hypothetical protein